jgi:imidazolonepropionase
MQKIGALIFRVTKNNMSLILKNIKNCVTWDSERGGMLIHENIDIAIEKDQIVEMGAHLGSADHAIDCSKNLVTPGFVDSHTHPVFLEGREKEFSMRLQGVSYEEIARAGGGIVSSVSGVREASEEMLIKKMTERMDTFLSLGTTTIEAKSGYGLDKDSELKSLSVIDKVNQAHAIDIHPTFMGAHAIPQEFKNDPNAYVQLICEEMLPAVRKQGIAEYCDVFCENGYFSSDMSKKILLTAKEHGLKIRLHADEFQNSLAANLAGELNAVSADHLMAISDEGIRALKENNVIATLLPGTTFFLGKTEYAPYAKMKALGLDIALATDFNPGSCHIQSMPFILSLACIYLKMDILDAIKATTVMGAKALQVEDEKGSLEVGKKADIVIWDLVDPVQIPYSVSKDCIDTVIKNGKIFKNS